jgi:hypothetical protein
MVVRLSALHAGRPLPPERFLVLFTVRGWVDLKAIVRLEGSRQLKNPITSSGTTPATFRLVAQCLLPTTILHASEETESIQDKFGTAGNASEISTGYSSNAGPGVLLIQQLSRCLQWRHKGMKVTTEHCVFLSHVFAARRRGGNPNTVSYSWSDNEIRDSVIKFVAFSNSPVLSFACSRGRNGTVLRVHGNNRSEYKVSTWLVTCSILG